MSFGVLTSAKEEVSLYLWIRGKRWKQFLDRQELPTRNSWNSSKIDQKRFIICLVFVTSNLSLALIPQNLTASDFHFVSAASFFLSFLLSLFLFSLFLVLLLSSRERDGMTGKNFKQPFRPHIVLRPKTRDSFEEWKRKIIKNELPPSVSHL